MDYQRKAATRHLRWLMGRYSAGWCELRGLSKGRVPKRFSVEIPALMSDGIDIVHAEIDRWTRDRYDVFVGVLPRSREHMVGKAGVDAIAAAGVFWADVDRKVPGASLDVLDGCELVIETGNGWHGYAAMPRIMELDIPSNRQVAPKLIRHWQTTILAGMDNVSDLSRVMRLAGTVNWKGEPKAVEIVRLDEPKPKPIVVPKAVKPRSEIGRPNPPDWTPDEETSYRAMHRMDAVVTEKVAAMEAGIPYPTDDAFANRRGWAERVIQRMIARGDAIGAIIDFASSEAISHGRVTELIEWMEGMENG